MSIFRVDVTENAAASIDEYRRFIAERSGSAKLAADWTDAVYDQFASLRYMPTRYDIASEGAGCSYEIRRLIVGNYLALYHVNQMTRTVSILAFRHGARLPQPGDLPMSPPEN